MENPPLLLQRRKSTTKRGRVSVGVDDDIWCIPPRVVHEVCNLSGLFDVKWSTALLTAVATTAATSPEVSTVNSLSKSWLCSKVMSGIRLLSKKTAAFVRITSRKRVVTRIKNVTSARKWDTQSCQPGILKMREISDFHQYFISTYRRGHKTNNYRITSLYTACQYTRDLPEIGWRESGTYTSMTV